jgi:hypothetical protein
MLLMRDQNNIEADLAIRDLTPKDNIVHTESYEYVSKAVDFCEKENISYGICR